MSLIVALAAGTGLAVGLSAGLTNLALAAVPRRER